MLCPQCGLAYNRSRKPMVMHCGHSSCSECFQEKKQCLCFICSHPGKPVINIALYEQVLKKSKNSIDKFYKICLFGNMGVGKTSLLKSLVGQKFCQEMTPTIGIDFKYIDKEVKGSLCRYQLWDSAGQQRYRCVSKNYLQSSDIILLVYDLGKSAKQNGLSYWIDEISELAFHNNVILIGNKLDLLQKQDKFEMKKCINQTQLNQISKRGWGFIKISCLTQQNIDTLWQMLTNQKRNKKHIDDTNISKKKSKIKEPQRIILNSKMVKQAKCPKQRCCQ